MRIMILCLMFGMVSKLLCRTLTDLFFHNH